MKYILETETESSFPVTKETVYDHIVGNVYGQDTKTPEETVHQIAADAQRFCEFPYAGTFEEEKFRIIAVADEEENRLTPES